MTKLKQILLALLPFLLTPLLFFALAEGWLNLGGGEKDILLVFPWFIWSVLFFLIAIIFVIKGQSVADWLKRSLFISVVLMLALYLIMLVLNVSGVI